MLTEFTEQQKIKIASLQKIVGWEKIKAIARAQGEGFFDVLERVNLSKTETLSTDGKSFRILD